MPLPRHAGRYIARPASWEVGEFNGSPTFEMNFQLLQFLDPQAGWQSVQGDMEIKKRFFLKKSDGSWSEHSIEALVSSLGWDGASLKSLAGGDWTAMEVQLTVGFETSKKDQKEYIGVIFMNPRDYEGQTLSSDPAIVQSLDAKYGAELRALRSTTKKPVVPAKPITPKPAKATSGTAWAEFKAKTPGMSDEARKASWFETVKAYSGFEAKAVPEGAWENVANSISERGPYVAPSPDDVPPSGEPELDPAVIRDDEIPF